MKGKLAELFFVFTFGVVLPLLICVLGSPVIQLDAPQEEIQITVTQPQKDTERIQVLTENGLEKMDLTEYITGVILGEMPGSFMPEAKKAQSVVARTYALRVASGDRHDGAVCTDSACCQSYRDPETVTDNEAVSSARAAAEATAGIVLTYNGQMIDATYFSCSGGMTEDAVAVWGSDIPYLQSVESPGEEYATHYMDTVTFTAEAFQEALGINLSTAPEQWFGAVTYTEGGGVDTMRIGGTSYSGTQLRKLLGLRSTVFEIVPEDDRIVITTRGYGHRVGMSQYGADAMARSGCDFAQILLHYYQGVELTENWG